jgi:hypothetical protein
MFIPLLKGFFLDILSIIYILFVIDNIHVNNYLVVNIVCLSGVNIIQVMFFYTETKIFLRFLWRHHETEQLMKNIFDYKLDIWKIANNYLHCPFQILWTEYYIWLKKNHSSLLYKNFKLNSLFDFNVIFYFIKDIQNFNLVLYNVQ